MIDALNKLDDHILFFVLIVFIILLDFFSHQAGMTDLSKMLVSSYGGYIMAKGKFQGGQI